MITLEKIQLAADIDNQLRTPMPQYIHKDKQGKTYVSGQSVIDKLNGTFGFAGWTWEIVESWVFECVPKVNKYPKNEPAKWTTENQNPVAMCKGRLTVRLKDKETGEWVEVSKMAPGAQPIIGGQSEQENCFKGAHTDALKKAATMFGIALELYRDQNEQAFYEEVSYVNPWTEEELEKHKEDFAFLKECKTKYNLTDEDLNNYVNNWSAGYYISTSYLIPDNINDFVTYLKDFIKSTQAAPKTPVAPHIPSAPPVMNPGA